MKNRYDVNVVPYVERFRGKMINFEEELKKFHPSLEIEDAADAIYHQDLSDMAGLVIQMLNETKKEDKN